MQPLCTSTRKEICSYAELQLSLHTQSDIWTYQNILWNCKKNKKICYKVNKKLNFYQLQMIKCMKVITFIPAKVLFNSDFFPLGWLSWPPSALLRPSWCGNLSTFSCVGGESMPKLRPWKRNRFLPRANQKKTKVREQGHRMECKNTEAP